MTVYQLYAISRVPITVFDKENSMLVCDMDDDFTSYLEDEVKSLIINGNTIQITIKNNTK